MNWTYAYQSHIVTPQDAVRAIKSGNRIFLSGNGLWVDWRGNWALNRAIEKIMMHIEGVYSAFNIAEKVGLDYWMVPTLKNSTQRDLSFHSRSHPKRKRRKIEK